METTLFSTWPFKYISNVLGDNISVLTLISCLFDTLLAIRKVTLNAWLRIANMQLVGNNFEYMAILLMIQHAKKLFRAHSPQSLPYNTQVLRLIGHTEK